MQKESEEIPVKIRFPGSSERLERDPIICVFKMRPK
jgi:hypothetical protein